MEGKERKAFAAPVLAVYVFGAASDDPKAQVTGQYFYHLKRIAPNPQAKDPALQDRLVAICAETAEVALAPIAARE